MKGRTRFSPVTLQMSDLEEKAFAHRLSQKVRGSLLKDPRYL